MAWTFVASVTVTFLVVIFLAPLAANLALRDVREPTSVEDWVRLDSLREGVGPHLDNVRIVETVGEASVEVSVRGPPSYKILFVTDYVLTDLDEEIARALLAAEAGRQAVYYAEYRAVTAAAVVGLGATALGGLVPFTDGMLVLAVGALVLFAGGRWLQYRADARAAEVVGAEQLADAFETVADLHEKELETSGWGGYLEVQPKLGDRVERLRESG